MSEYKFHKRICTNQHSSEVVSIAQPLPRRCPVCGEPYNNRNHPPLLCDENGNLKEEHAAQTEGPPADAAPERLPAGRRGEAVPGGTAAAGRGSQLRGARIEAARLPDPDDSAHQIRKPQLTQTEGSGLRAQRVKTAGDGSGALVLRSGAGTISVPTGGAVLGRAGLGAELLVMNQAVSREHAYIRADRTGEILVRDLKSLNGTSVNTGEGRIRLEPEKPVCLRKGDRLWLADQLFIVEGE